MTTGRFSVARAIEPYGAKTLNGLRNSPNCADLARAPNETAIGAVTGPTSLDLQRGASANIVRARRRSVPALSDSGIVALISEISDSAPLFRPLVLRRRLVHIHQFCARTAFDALWPMRSRYALSLTRPRG